MIADNVSVNSFTCCNSDNTSCGVLISYGSHNKRLLHINQEGALDQVAAGDTSKTKSKRMPTSR